jgi:capsular polysaccharide biosynthesis protein
MTYSFWQTIKERQSIVWWWLVSLLALATLVSFLQPLKYSAESQILVVSDYRQTSDPYQISRTNEYLSSLLAQVTYSSSFFEATVKPEYQIDTAYFGDTAKKRMTAWHKTIKVKPINDSGVISVKAYHPDKQQAEKLVRAINYNLITKNNYYHGLGDKVILKVIDEPLISTWPAKPNLPINFGLAIMLGVLIGLAQIYITNTNQNETEYSETVMDWPSSEAIKDIANQTVRPELEPESIMAKAQPYKQMMQSDGFLEPRLAMETVEADDNDEQDITDQIVRGGNIDNIFAS